MAIFRIVNTDNFNGDYPNEKFVENLPVFTTLHAAEKVAQAINSTQHELSDRYFKVVEDGYVLQPGFEP